VITPTNFIRRTAVAALAIALATTAATGAHAQVVRKGLPGGPPRDTAAARRARFGTIDGFVGDTSLAPLQAAEVKILSSNVKVSTGPNGRFRISQVPVGQYVLIVRRAGYQPVSAVVQVGADTLRPSYALERGTTLDAAVVTAERGSPRMAGFEARRKVAQGEFMTADQIARRNTVFATELMRRFTSVNVGPSYTSGSGGAPEYLALSRREGGSVGVGACPMVVVVDNVTMPTPFNLENLPSPKYLAGIEVYSGAATVPPQFAGMNRGCGVIVVWTKDGY
jgi:hypothetical protein